MADTIDPETGEVFETRAADGGQRYPAANTLADLIIMQRDGQFNADTAEVLREFNEKLEAAGHDGNGKAKGRITLTLDVEYDPSREFCVITPGLTIKLPAAKHGQTVTWFTADNRMSPNKPNQGNFFGTIREITTEARTVRG